MHGLTDREHRLAVNIQQSQLITATVNLQSLLSTHPGMPDIGGWGGWTLSLGMPPGGSDGERHARVDEVAEWMGAQAVWRNSVYMAQRDMGYGRLILDCHYTPDATKAEIARRISRGEVTA